MINARLLICVLTPFRSFPSNGESLQVYPVFAFDSQSKGYYFAGSLINMVILYIIKNP
jgi:hypothetical protein